MATGANADGESIGNSSSMGNTARHAGLLGLVTRQGVTLFHIAVTDLFLAVIYATVMRVAVKALTCGHHEARIRNFEENPCPYPIIEFRAQKQMLS